MKRTQKRQQPRRAVLETIEPRILYSADFSPGLLDSGVAPADVEQRVLDTGGEFAQTGALDSQQRRHEIVFVDPATPDYAKLIDDMRAQNAERDIEVVLLKSTSDGINQISKNLAGREDISAIHIVSHGTDGSVQLGKTSLDFESLLKSASKIKGWGQALSADADILIYGCNVAQSEAGRSLVDALARLTGADVAASDDLTGAAEKGGDWDLEYRTGGIETALAISTGEQFSYSGTLATYTVTNTNDSGAGSLRTAINSANASVGVPDTIAFNIAGTGVKTISPTSALPVISDTVTIDGTTQRTFSGDTGTGPLIELDGASAGGGTSGLILDTGSSGSTIRGLAIHSFTASGIRILNSSNNLIAGNFLGTDAAGTAAAGNQVGIFVTSSSTNNTIGGTAAADRNVISANTVDGIQIFGAGTQDNTVIGNIIGLDVTGTVDLGNTNQGVAIFSGATDNTIGGTGANEGNIISGNDGDGIAVTINTSTGNRISGNAIYANSDLGIDLGNNGVTANDGSVGGAPNNGMDFPVISSATLSGTTLTVSGYIGTASGDIDFATARVEFFESPDATGANGEGQTYLGYLTADGNGNFSGPLTVAGLAAGDRVTATATDGANNTSEFGVNVAVVDPNTPPVASDDSYSVNEDGTLSVSWWNTSWQNREKITFDNTNSAENLADFAVLVRLDSSNIDFAKIKAAGADIRFVDADGAPLAYEIESWDDTPGSESANVWVKVPQIDAGSTTDSIWIYYNNVAASDAQNAAGAWPAGIGVWHLANDPGPGGAGDIKDADASPVNGTAEATMTSADLVTGRVGSAINFDGTAGYIDFASTDVGNTFTISAWIKPDSTGSNTIKTIASNSAVGNTTNGFRFFMNSSGTNDRKILFETGNGSAGDPASTAVGAVTLDQWNHVAVTVDRAGGTAQIYVNGVDVTVDNTIRNDFLTSSDWEIGRIESANLLRFKGVIDEFQIANVARSADWVEASYLTQNGTFAFNTFGGEELAPGVGGVLDNDTDANGDLLTVNNTPVVDVSNGTLILNADGTFTYTPNADFFGIDSFTYEVSDGNGGTDMATVSITVNAVNDEPSFALGANQTVAEDAGAQSVAGFTTPAAGGGANESAQTFTYTVSNNNNALFSAQPTIDAGGSLSYTAAANAFGSATVTMSVTDSGGTANGGDDTSPSQTFTITVGAVADTASVTNATTNEDTQTSSGLVISRNGADGAEVTHFKITGITGGTLYQNDGTTAINNGDFITFAQGNAGLKFTPSANSTANGNFDVQASTSALDAGLAGGIVTATISVAAVADTPAVTNASTNEDAQTASGLVISRNAADGAEVTHFKITGITGGTLYQNNGTTAINNGDFITFAQGNAGLKFTPSANSTASGSFNVQASTSNVDAGLGGGVVSATITVNAVNDEPSFTVAGNQTVAEDAGAQSVVGFASALPGGGADEAAQTFTYTVSNNNNALFSAQPTINASGTLSYTSAANVSGSATVTVFVTDSGGTANGGDNTSPSQTFTITVNAVADAPTVVLPGPALAYVENQAGQVIDATATVSDPEGNWTGGTLRAQITANSQAADRLTILNTGGVSVAVNGTDVLVGATIVGTVPAATVTGGNALTITFNAAATGAHVQAVARAIGYYSSSQDPSTAARTITFTATDSGALAGGATQTVSVTRVNDAPTLTAIGLNPSFAQGAASPVNLFNAASASTIEPGQSFSQLVLTVSNLANGAAERLRIDGTLVGLTNGNSATTATNSYGVGVTVAGSTATVTITTTGATAAQLQNLVNGLAYHNNSGAPTGGPRTVRLTGVQDSGGTANGGADTAAISVASNVTVTTSGAIPVATNDAYSLNEEGTLTVSGVSGWWDTSWQYRRQITIDNLGRSQLTDYPILVALNSSNIDYAQTQNQGQDLRFVDGNGALLAHEIENWNESGTSYVWVRVPVVDANSSSDYITMYYGNAAAPDAQNANAVWNASYAGVWHLDEAGSGAANEYVDSSGTGNHGLGGAGVATATPTQAAGRVGGGQNFDGVDDLISVANSASLQLTSAMTLEGWLRMDTFGVADVVDVLLRKGEDNPNNYQLSVGNQTPFFTLDDGENTGVVGPSTLSAGQWYHLSATFDGSTRRVYVNGVELASDAYAGPIGTDLRNLYIGGRTGTDFSDGVIDEARISSTARSADWIAAQYANVTSVGYLSFGAQQSATGGGVLFNDSDADGQPLAAVVVAPPANAAAFTLNANGSFTYTPNANFAGTDTFTYRANDGSNNSNVATVTITVNPINDEPSFTVAGNQTVSEDAGAQAVAGFATPSAGGGADEAVQTFAYTLSNNNNALFAAQPTINATGTLSYTAAANTFGSATVTVFVTDSGGTAGGGDNTSPSQTFTITVNPVADTPAVSNATTNEDIQTSAGLVISRNAADGAEVTHFKITGISGGTLYRNNGTTVINNGDFITFAQGNAGLKFTPSLNSTASGSFQVQASTSGVDAGLGGGVVVATITVNPVNDAPVVTAGAATAYTENAAAVVIDNTVTVADVDDTQITGATVTISAGLTAGDVLSFVNTASITGSYNAGTGVLTLTGSDTLANYEAALRSATYSSISEDPTAVSSTRTIRWQVTDANAQGTGALSSALVTSTVNLTALADAPVLSAGASIAYTENAAALVIDNTITVADVDDTQIGSATVTISAGFTAGDVLSFVNTASITGVYNAGTGVLTLTGTDTLANYQAALRSVTYRSTSDDPTALSATRSIAWQVTDANSDAVGPATSAVVTSTVNLTALADAPVLTAGATTAYSENAPAVAIDNTITLADADDTQIAGATVTIGAGLTAGDVLSFANTASITGSYNAGTGVLTLTGSDTLANYQAALRSVTFSSTSEDPTASSVSRTIAWQVIDANSDATGAQSSAVVTSSVNVTPLNDAPVLSAGASIAYTENAAALVIDNTITVADVDDTQIGSATVTISAGFTAGDVLGFVNTASITGVYNAGTGVLTLTGTDTLANYQAALRSVTYRSTSDDPTALSATRSIAWQVTDANSDAVGPATSAVVTSTVNLTALADAPVLTAGATTAYSENAPAVAIDNTITLADADDTQIAGATVTIGAGLTAGDVLSFANTASITGSYNAGTGVLTLTGSDTLANYEAALRSATYSSISEDPTAVSSTRTIRWQVTDANAQGTGALSSALVTSTVNLTALADAPVLSAGASIAYTENAAALVIDNTITVADVDDTQIGSATVTISAGFTAGDVLSFVNTASITGVYNAGTGVLTLTGTDTLANYQAALRSVTYRSTSDDPTALSATRSIAWQVTDANSDAVGPATSAVVTSTVNLTALADAPVLTAGATTAYSENAPAVAIDNTITLADADDTQIAGATVTIGAGLTAGDVLSFANTASITGSYNAGTGVLTLTGSDTLANYQAALRSVTFSSTSEDPTASSVSRTIAWQVIDANSDATGAQSSALVISTVNLTALVDAPVVTAGATATFTENTAALVIDNTITVSDADDTQITGATVTISAGFTAGDVLSFVNTASITGVYNAGTGVLTLTGTDTLANYQAALRSVTYRSTSDDPTALSATRSIAWQVTDADSEGLGAQTSAMAISSVNITAINDAPVATDDNGATDEDTLLNVAAAGVLGNDSDVDDGPLAVSAVEGNPADVGNPLLLASGALVTLNADGSFSYDPNGAFDWLATGETASDAFSYEVSDGNGGFATANVTIDLSGVNDAPSGTDATIALDEDSAYIFTAPDFGFSDADVSENFQAVRIVGLPGAGSLTLSGVAVSAGQLISEADITLGNLVFTPATDANGAGYASFTFRVNDGTVDSVAANTLTLDVIAINDAPSFTQAGNQSVNEDAGAQSVAGFAAASPGGGTDEAGQGFAYTVSNDNNALFLVQPTLDAAGNLTYTAAAEANGVATVTVFVSDNGGTANGGVDTSASQVFTLTVNAVNDAPTLAIGANQMAAEDAGAQSVAGFASRAPGGGPDEAGQALSYAVSNDNNALFSVQPTLDAAGNLSYTPASDAFGMATVTVWVSDSGGTANSGVDTSASQSFTITLNPVNDAPLLGANALTIDQGGSVVLDASVLSASDVDTPTGALTFIVSNVMNGRFELTSAPGVAVTTFTQAEVVAGQVRFVHNNSAALPGFDVQVDDGALIIGPFSASVSFNPAPAPSSPPALIPPVPVPAPPPPPPADEVLESEAVDEPGASLVDAGFSPGRVPANFNDLSEISVRLAKVEARVARARLIVPAPEAKLNDYTAGQSIQPDVQMFNLMPAQLTYTPSTPVDWDVAAAFGEGAQEQIRDELQVLLDSVKFGGMALSVGVVWWASRISAMLGSLLASTPAWRHIDPLPVVGRDEEDEDKWLEPDDRDADANELAVSLVLDGGRTTTREAD